MSLERTSCSRREERDELEHTVAGAPPARRAVRDLEQQHETAALGMWVFLATEVMFFGTLFLGARRLSLSSIAEAFEKASEKLNWMIGGINTVVLLVSSLFMVLAVHYAKLGQQQAVVPLSLAVTAAAGRGVPGLQRARVLHRLSGQPDPRLAFDDAANGSTRRACNARARVPHVKLFLLFYWIMTGLHAAARDDRHRRGAASCSCWRGAGRFTPDYYSPVDVTGLYWHFVDLVWIFLLPMLYLLGTHSL